MTHQGLLRFTDEIVPNQSGGRRFGMRSLISPSYWNVLWHTAAGLLSVVNGTAGKTASEAASTGLPVTITGTSSKPIITPDVGGMIKSNGQHLTNKLTSLFGGKKK